MRGLQSFRVITDNVFLGYLTYGIWRNSVLMQAALTNLTNTNTNLCFTALLHFIGAWWHSFIHSSLKISPPRFSQVEVWTMIGPLQHIDSFLFLL